MALQFPLIYLLSTHLSFEERQTLEEQIEDHDALTYDLGEAAVVLGNISKKERALFELRRLKLSTEEVLAPPPQELPTPKRRRTSGSSPAAEGIDSSSSSDEDPHPPGHTHGPESPGRAAGSSGHGKTIKVVKLAWFTDSLETGAVLPFKGYLIYEGRKVEPLAVVAAAAAAAAAAASRPAKPLPKAEDILKRARADADAVTGSAHLYNYSRASSRRTREARTSPPVKPPPLVRQTTTEHEGGSELPPIPDYLHTTYSCQRPTPVHSPNEAFIEELKKIRTIRTLKGDKIGIRAYSSAIASLAAYPYTISTAPEVERLPGCGPKIAVLFQEFRDTGQVKEARETETDPRLLVLKTFYDIWGVADTTAREFYNRGWRDIDDIVEYGWSSLTRVQQIGVKYYDEFQLKIPRSEVEAIANAILSCANTLRPGYQMVIVGGYRRGKEQSGDVDVIISHPDESATRNAIESLVVSLEKDNYITHTLTLSIKNSERGQEPVSWKGNDKKAGSGFDTLDKAMVVWQDPHWIPESGSQSKNPNPHRRVDIIISPWKTVGCAVLGWTSGTTFQRDLRRYCKRERSLKFDSSGIRSRADGSWVDLEDGGKGKAPDMLTAERRVFAGLGLEWRPPEERCTG